MCPHGEPLHDEGYDLMGYRKLDGGCLLYEFPASARVREVPVDKKRMAAILGVNPKFLERRHRAPGFPVTYDVAGRARYIPSEVHVWLAKQGSDEGDAA